MSPGISPLPSPARSTFSESSIRETFGAHKVERSSAIPEDPDTTLKSKPSIKINGVQIDEPPRSNKPTTTTPAKRYLGWLSDVVAPLEEFIDGATDPRDHYIELQEIAEAESGSVYAARLVKPEVLGLPLDVAFVAIKNVPILPSGSPKLLDLKKELTLVRGVTHKNILTMDALYVDLVEDSLWIRMELMERSLADVVGLVAEGLMVQERMIARFASDVLQALEYLQKQHIAHRDVRSDNLLLNSNGFLKLADFSNAVQVTPENSDCSGAAGVIYWQAPEMRTGGTYHALKVDVWSLGATVWETAQSEPPFTDIQDPRQFGDRWPSLTHPEIYSRSFHDFLRLCSEPAATRPDPSDLLNTPFIRNACGRPVNVHLLSQCRAIEETMLERENDS
ncbi:kinase-like protein [Athelia psychrophila]|uniref:Kinase-like protein n=1 Tax=Athelia psychrophila TaxID=1759441 RepID=A0A165WF98_9AGAM|nr:kinase-like protein [Fibularhizoctonia sp. CBS 109695]